MQNIYYLLEILQNGGGIQGLWCRPDTRESYKLWKDLIRCPLQEVWWPIPLNRHWCFPLMYWWSVVRNVWTFGLPTDCSWIPFIEDEDPTLNYGYGVTTCRIYYHPTLCVLCQFGMLMESFPSPEIPDCIEFSSPSIRALGDVEVPISVGNNLEITPVSPFAKMSTNISLY